MSADCTGSCEHCGRTFSYQLHHNGFGDTAYAYCDSCGSTAYLSGWFDGIPQEADLKVHGPIHAQLEPLLASCSCGGRFTTAALPQCPHCKGELCAERARVWIEREAPGTAEGWSWQGSWSGLYSIVIEKNSVSDPWARR